jgi:CHAT domain-containing protein
MTEAAKMYRHSATDNNLLAMRSEDERGRWNYLKGTKTESQNVYDLLTSSRVSSTLLQDASANEESFKALNGQSPSIIHLSTHGFFLDTTDKIKKNPFMNNIGGYS